MPICNRFAFRESGERVFDADDRLDAYFGDSEDDHRCENFGSDLRDAPVRCDNG